MNEYVDIDLMFDVLDRDNVRDGLTNQDLNDSRDFPIRVCYDLVDLGRTSYNFRQKFTEDDTRLYFERMRVICSIDILPSLKERDSGVSGNSLRRRSYASYPQSRCPDS